MPAEVLVAELKASAEVLVTPVVVITPTAVVTVGVIVVVVESAEVTVVGESNLLTGAKL